MDSEDIFIDLSDFKSFGGSLGEGGFGKVFVVIEKSTNKQFAAKELDASSYNTPNAQKLLLREVINLSKLHHIAIVQFKGFSFISFNDPQKWQPTIFTEFVENKSLLGVLNQENRSLAPLEWTSTKKFINILGIASALKYLHLNELIHRDLKPDNILLDKNFYPKVCDFGLARTFSGNKTRCVGTRDYMAPEILIGDEYDEKVDVYSFAILAFQIVTGLTPYPGIPDEFNMKVLNRIINGSLRPKIPEYVNKNMKKLIEQCWSSDPSQRPSFEEIFSELSEHFNDFQDDLDEDEIMSYIDLLEEKDCSNLSENQNDHIKISEYQDDHFTLNEHKKDYDSFKECFQFYFSNDKGKEILCHACLNENIKLVNFLLSQKDININTKFTISLMILCHFNPNINEIIFTN